MAIVSLDGRESESVDRPRDGAGHYWMQLMRLCSDPTKRKSTGVPGLYWPGICMLILYEDVRLTIPAIAACMGHHKGHVSRVLKSTRAKLRDMTTGGGGVLDAVEQLARDHALVIQPYARMTNREWRYVEPLVADDSFTSGSTRAILDAVIEKHTTGIPWRILPMESTKRRAYRSWKQRGIWAEIVRRLDLEIL